MAFTHRQLPLSETTGFFILQICVALREKLYTRNKLRLKKTLHEDECLMLRSMVVLLDSLIIAFANFRVVIDNKLTFSRHLAKKVNRVNSILGIIKRTFVFS